MILELIGQLNSDLHPMYLYLTFYLTMLCAYGLLYVSHYHVTKQKGLMLERRRKSSLQIYDTIDILGQIQDIRSWIIKKMKRKDSPNDDEDNKTSSINYLFLLIRGGQSCLSTLYSHSLRNIILSV